jgi:hypothetical protein
MCTPPFPLQAACVKIIKKHDKSFPDTPLWAFYLSHLAAQVGVRV